MSYNLSNFSKILKKSSHDDWKYTNLSRYSLDTFKPVLPALLSQTESISHDSTLKFIQPFLLDPKSSQQILFYNGCQLQGDGSVFTIPKNCIIPDPIYIVHIIKPETTPLMIHPKNFILAEEGSTATIVEIIMALGDHTSFTNTVTNIKLAKGARLNHVFLQRSLSQSLQIAHIEINQSRESFYTGTAITLGGETNRAAFEIHLDEPKAQCQFYALIAANQCQQMDIHFIVQHHKPHTESSIISRGMMKDKAKGAFTGKIVVQEGAYKSKAFLENKNLLLSSEAEANTRPQLEIYNHDIQCAHGATVGHLDLDALFYLKSRGIPEKEAIQLLIDSFIAPSLQGLSPYLQTVIAELIHEY